MIIGLGIDSIEIERFAHWHQLSPISLRRLFTQQEISYCLQNGSRSAQRFAVRFATRESFFKAIQSAYPTIHIPFLSICTAIELSYAENNSPHLLMNKEMLHQLTNHKISPSLSALISVTHTKTTATVCILLQA